MVLYTLTMRFRMAQPDSIDMIYVHTVCGTTFEFYHPKFSSGPVDGLVEIYEEATPKKRFYFSQIDYIEVNTM
jgi:hypothetical protein